MSDNLPRLKPGGIGGPHLARHELDLSPYSYTRESSSAFFCTLCRVLQQAGGFSFQRCSELPGRFPGPPITKQGHLPHRLLLLPRPTSCSDLQKFPLTPAEGARRSIPSRCMYLGQEYLKSAVHLSVYMSMPMHMCMCMNMCIYVCTYIICG